MLSIVFALSWCPIGRVIPFGTRWWAIHCTIVFLPILRPSPAHSISECVFENGFLFHARTRALASRYTLRIRHPFLSRVRSESQLAQMRVYRLLECNVLYGFSLVRWELRWLVGDVEVHSGGGGLIRSEQSKQGPLVLVCYRLLVELKLLNGLAASETHRKCSSGMNLGIHITYAFNTTYFLTIG